MVSGLLLFLTAILFIFQTCKKFEPDGFLDVGTGAVSEITSTSASVSCIVRDDGGATVSARGVCWSTSSNPTVTGNKTNDGTGTGGYDSEITGLSPGTTYYVRSYATNSKGTTYGNEVSFLTNENSPVTVTDIDGNEYQVVLIGDQIWMAENLKTTQYADGTDIPLVESTTEWDLLEADDKAYCWYDNSTTNRDIYGGLYTWAAALNGNTGSDANPSGVQGVCPAGWHLPSDTEWKELEMYLGMSQSDADDTNNRGTDEGGKLKEVGTIHWNSPNTGATNESGFSALPGGRRNIDGSFEYLSSEAYFWTSRVGSYGVNAWIRNLFSFDSYVFRSDLGNKHGFSVRCIKDEGTSALTPTVTTTTATSVDASSAIMNGEVTDDGGATVTDCGFYYGTSTDPVSSGTPVSESSGTGSYSTALTGLTPATTYYFVAYATNSAGTAYGDELSFTTSSGSAATVTDIDGNEYQAVQIGDQVWMAENLKTTRYADGTDIPLVESTSEWDLLEADDKAYCWYDNSTTNRDIYGGLYTWAAALNGNTGSDANPGEIQGVCPAGWHVPSDSEWKELEMYLGMSQSEADNTDWRGTDEGGKLKETGTTHWDSPNDGATNSSGFKALPGGRRLSDGVFDDGGTFAYLWSATEHLTQFALTRRLSYISADICRDNYYRYYGYSVRCVKGEGSTISIPSVSTGAATSVGASSAVINGDVTGDGGATVTDCGFYFGTSADPVSSGTPVAESSGTDSFSTTLTGLTPGTTYYFVAYATNSAGTAYGDELNFTTSSGTTVTDIDGNVYQTVQIGEQVWMAENLMTTRYADGTAIPFVETTSGWDALDENSKAYCWYDDAASNGAIYGGLYTWPAAMNGAASSDANPSGVQGVCPTGWHLPSDSEWKELEMYLGMSQSDADAADWRGTVEGGKLKEAGTDHWQSPNTGATNESGFTALPGGYRIDEGSFYGLSLDASIWTSTTIDEIRGWIRYLGLNSSEVNRILSFNAHGRSVRCVQD